MKKYSVNMENDEVVSIEVDGIEYASPDDISDEQDRDQVNRLITRTAKEEFDAFFDDQEFEQEFRSLQKETSRFPTLITAVFLTVAAILLVIAAFSTYSAVRRLSVEQRAPGRVVDLVVQRSRDQQTNEIKEYSYPVVEFAAPGQSRQSVRLSEGSWPPAYAVGDRVVVLYDPLHPQSARIKSFASSLLLWLLPAITGGVGLIFLVVTLFVVKLSAPAKEMG